MSEGVAMTHTQYFFFFLPLYISELHLYIMASCERSGTRLLCLGVP